MVSLLAGVHFRGVDGEPMVMEDVLEGRLHRRDGSIRNSACEQVVGQVLELWLDGDRQSAKFGLRRGLELVNWPPPVVKPTTTQLMFTIFGKFRYIPVPLNMRLIKHNKVATQLT